MQYLRVAVKPIKDSIFIFNDRLNTFKLVNTKCCTKLVIDLMKNFITSLLNTNHRLVAVYGLINSVLNWPKSDFFQISGKLKGCGQMLTQLL